MFKLIEKFYTKPIEKFSTMDEVLLLGFIPSFFCSLLIRYIRALFAHHIPISYVVKSEANWITQSEAELLVEEAIAFWEAPVGRKLFKKSNRGLKIVFSQNIPEKDVLGIFCPITNTIIIYRHRGDVCDLRTTIAHECGHIISLGHSNGPDDVMRKTNRPLEELSAAEKQIVKRKYGK